MRQWLNSFVMLTIKPFFIQKCDKVQSQLRKSGIMDDFLNSYRPYPILVLHWCVWGFISKWPVIKKESISDFNSINKTIKLIFSWFTSEREHNGKNYEDWEGGSNCSGPVCMPVGRSLSLSSNKTIKWFALCT